MTPQAYWSVTPTGSVTQSEPGFRHLSAVSVLALSPLVTLRIS